MCDGSKAWWFIEEDYGKTVKLKCRVCGDFKIAEKEEGKKQ